jgi:DNA repair exonuclease SbcCD ATPase subunit
MIGRKKKREKGNNEEEEGSLHKNNTLLEYQNKQLFTLVNQLRDNISEKEQTNEKLEKNFKNVCELFTYFSSELNKMNDALNISIKENKIEYPENEKTEEKKKIFSSSSEILKLILTSNEKFDLNQYEIESIKTLSNSINLLSKNLIPLLKDNGEKLSEIFHETSQDILEINTNLEKKLIEQTTQSNNNLKEIESLKSQCEIYESKLKESNVQIENLKSENFKLKRRINTNPTIPYITLEKQVFQESTEEHKCLCLYCGKEINTNIQNISNENGENNLSENKNENQIKEDEQNELREKENEALRNRIKELYEQINNSPNQINITEEMIIQSKCFQTLISQAENILSKFENLKEINNELRKKNNSLNQIKENEINELTQKFYNQVEEYKNKIFEMTEIIEKDNQNIKLLMNKIESLENTLKAKESFDNNAMYDMFSNERNQLLKQMDDIESIKKEYIKKYDDECEKNKINVKNIFKLKEEIQEIKSNQNLKENERERDRKIDTENEIIKRKKEKIEYYKREVERLNTELTKERKQYENLIILTQTTEKELTDLNSIIKNLRKELQDTKEIQAEMSNDKLKDNQTISLLQEEKEVYEKKISNFQEQIENYDIYTKKIDGELAEYKKLNSSLENLIELNEKDIQILKQESFEYLKNIEKEKTTNNSLQNQINELNNQKSKLLTEYDVLKIKYDELLKMKKMDISLMNYEELQKEYNSLKKDFEKYREMVHCKVCKTNMKNVVITKCFHTFCRGCVEASFETRKRRCPICREAISPNDIKDIFWD